MIREHAPVAGRIVRVADRLFRRAGPSASSGLRPLLVPGPDPESSERRLILDGCHPARSKAGVLLITVDGLRPDRMGLYGDWRGATPCPDALGREGLHFPETRAQYSGTRFLMASLFRSRYPACTPEYRLSFHVGQETGGPPLFAERLRSEGFTTAAFVPLDENDLSNPERFGFLRVGMDQVQNLHHGSDQGTSGPVAAAALQFLRGRGPERAFAWVRFNEAHVPYQVVRLPPRHGRRGTLPLRGGSGGCGRRHAPRRTTGRGIPGPPDRPRPLGPRGGVRRARRPVSPDHHLRGADPLSHCSSGCPVSPPAPPAPP